MIERQVTGRRQSGFTIVELLIVIVVVGILAAITIVAYNGVQNRANDASVEADLSTAAKQLEVLRVDLGRYPIVGSEFTDVFKLNKSAYLTDNSTQNALYCVNKTTDNYALYVVSKSGQNYILHNGAVSKGYGNVCALIGTSWKNDAETAVIHGYHTVAGWRAEWPWTN